MKLLVFEYSTVCLDNYLINEGFNMLKGMLDNLENISFFDTYFLINKKLPKLNFKNCSPIYLEDDIGLWLKKYSEEFDYCLFVAPEDNLIQYKICKILEENNVSILGSSSNASFICSSKFLTYKYVPEELKIDTLKINSNDVDFSVIENHFKSFDFIVKPDNRTSSNLIFHVNNENEFKEILELYEKEDVDDVLLQEYISGDSVSVSIICDDSFVNCISINSQEIRTENNKITYIGCVTPIEHEYKNELFQISERIIKSIPNLKGFVGIDYIINEDKIYFVEVNARITTPFIVLQKQCNDNLIENIIELLINKKRKKISFKNSGSFCKEE